MRIRLVMLAYVLVSLRAFGDNKTAGPYSDRTLAAFETKVPDSLKAAVRAEDRRPENLRNYWSWYRCAICQSLIDEGTRVVELEQEKAAVAGVTDKRALYAGQELVVAGRRCAKAATTAATRNLPLAACKSRETTRVEECMRENMHTGEAWCLLAKLYDIDAPTRQAWIDQVLN